MRVERPPLHARGHGRDRRARRGPAGELDPRAGTRRRERIGGGGAGRGRPRRAAPGRRRARRSAAPGSRCRASSRPTSATAPRTSRWPPSSTVSASATRCRCPPPRVWGPETCWIGSSSCWTGSRPRTPRTRTTRQPVRLAVIGRPERGQVLAGQPLPGPRARDRLRPRRHHPRRDRHRPALRREGDHAGGHGRHPPRRQGRRLGRVLHGAALAAGRRTRRRGAGRVRRQRRGHRAGPAHRRAGDEGRLRDRAGAEQVGRAGRAGRRRGARPRARARTGPGGRASCVCARAC